MPCGYCAIKRIWMATCPTQLRMVAKQCLRHLRNKNRQVASKDILFIHHNMQFKQLISILHTHDWLPLVVFMRRDPQGSFSSCQAEIYSQLHRPCTYWISAVKLFQDWGCSFHSYMHTHSSHRPMFRCP